MVRIQNRLQAVLAGKQAMILSLRISPDFVNKRIFGHLMLLTSKPLSQEVLKDINKEKKRLTKMGSELISLYRFI